MAVKELKNTFKIFVALPLPKAIMETFYEHKDSNFELTMSDTYSIKRNDFLAGLKGCDAALISSFVKMDKKAFEAAGSNLRLISTFSIGHDHIDLKECRSRNVRITLSPYFGSATVSEFAIGLLLNMSRNITSAINASKGVDWTTFRKDIYSMSGVGLKNSTVGIFGLGHIGMNIAKRLSAFEVAKILYKDRRRKQEAEHLGYEFADMKDLVARSDFVICACSLNPQTERVFNAATFSLMKTNAIFVNIARGQCVDQDALYDALKVGRIRAAGLDHTTPIVLPPHHKLYSLSNCYITPYLAWAERSSINERLRLCAHNILKFFSMKPLLYELKIDQI